MNLNEQGVPAGELREAMREMASEDKQWKERLAAGVSYPAGDDVLEPDERLPRGPLTSMM